MLQSLLSTEERQCIQIQNNTRSIIYGWTVPLRAHIYHIVYCFVFKYLNIYNLQVKSVCDLCILGYGLKCGLMKPAINKTQIVCSHSKSRSLNVSRKHIYFQSGEASVLQTNIAFYFVQLQEMHVQTSLVSMASYRMFCELEL